MPSAASSTPSVRTSKPRGNGSSTTFCHCSRKLPPTPRSSPACFQRALLSSPMSSAQSKRRPTHSSPTRRPTSPLRSRNWRTTSATRLRAEPRHPRRRPATPAPISPTTCSRLARTSPRSSRNRPAGGSTTRSPRICRRGHPGRRLTRQRPRRSTRCSPTSSAISRTRSTSSKTSTTLLNAAVKDKIHTSGDLSRTQLADLVSDVGQIIHDALVLCDKLANTGLDAMKAALGGFDDILTTPLVTTVPLLSEILSFAKIDIDITVGQVLSMLIAFPATLISKVAFKTGVIFPGSPPAAGDLGDGDAGQVGHRAQPALGRHSDPSGRRRRIRGHGIRSHPRGRR